jgi:lipopolysaccharide transport system permease protein
VAREEGTPEGTARDLEIVVEPSGIVSNYWRDFWRHRELLYFLVWRDIIVRYKQMMVGIGWSVLRPLITTMVMVLVFGKLAGLSGNGVPYTLVVLTGLLGWQLFAAGLSGASGSMLSNANLTAKVYFPRLIIPTCAILATLVDFVISCGVLALAMAWLGHCPSWRIVFLPGLIGLTLFLAAGAGLWLGAINVRYRDVNNITPLLLQVGIYVSPVGYSSSLVPASWRMLYALNPMTSLIDGYRWALLGHGATVYWPGFLVSALLIGSLLVSGLWYFRKMEPTFVDVL